MNENAATIQSYENHSEDFINSRSVEQEEKYSKWIVDVLSAYDNTVGIFEVGTGPGHTADYLESKGYSVVRSDIVNKFIDYNRSRGKKVVKHNVIKDDIPGKFEVILALNVMQHMNRNDTKMALSRIKNGLVSNGKFLFTITFGDNDEWRDNKGGSRFFAGWKEDELRDYLDVVGFRMDSIEPVGYKNWFRIVASCK